jgi:hypothetical protein
MADHITGVAQTNPAPAFLGCLETPARRKQDKKGQRTSRKPELSSTSHRLLLQALTYSSQAASENNLVF